MRTGHPVIVNKALTIRKFWNVTRRTVFDFFRRS